jgi:hypothetical protein
LAWWRILTRARHITVCKTSIAKGRLSPLCVDRGGGSGTERSDEHEQVAIPCRCCLVYSTPRRRR